MPYEGASLDYVVRSQKCGLIFLQSKKVRPSQRTPTTSKPFRRLLNTIILPLNLKSVNRRFSLDVFLYRGNLTAAKISNATI